ncbi:MAG: autotransporter-associated beta strand repeat-containing protein [Verrucomicrobiota bacterium]
MLANGSSLATCMVTINGGTLTLSGTNLYTCPTNLNGGALNLAHADAFANNTLTMNGGSLVFDSSAGTSFNLGGLAANSSGAGYDIALLNNSGQNVALAIGGNNASTTYGGVLSGGGSLTKSGTGTLTLSGQNTYTGVTAIGSGTLSLGSAENLGVSGPLGKSGAVKVGTTGQILFGGGWLQYSALNQNDYSGRMSTWSSSPYNVDTNGQNVTWASPLPNGTNTALNKAGAGTLSLSGINAYTGATNILGGTLKLSNQKALQSSVVTMKGGSLAFDSAVSAHAFTVAGLAASSSGAGYDITLQDTASNAVTLSVGNSSSATYAGTLSGIGGITKVGTGSQTLAGANTYTGVTTLTSGSVNLGIAENAGTSGPLGNGGAIVFNSARLQYSAVNQHDYSNRFSTDAHQQYVVDTNGQNVTWATALTSAGGSLTKIGNGTLTLTAANTFDGATNLNGGTLNLSNSNALAMSTLTMNGGSLVFDRAVSGHAFTSGGLAGSSDLALQDNGFNAVALTVGGNNASTRYAGALTGDGSLTKVGTGTQTLTGTNTYTGATIVTGGTLLVNNTSGSGSGAVSVANGATLGGSGSIGGPTTIAGIHAPGDGGPGIQSFSNSLTYAATGHLQWQLAANASSDRGSNFDGVDITGGTFSIANGAIIDLIFGASVNFLNTFWNTNQSWMLVDLGAGLTGNGGTGGFTLGTLNGGSGTPTGSFAVTRVADGGGKNDAILNWTASAGRPYNIWVASKGLTGNAALPDADLDHDGIPNSLEFVLGGEPNPASPGSNSRSLLPVVSRNGNGDMLFTFQRKNLSESTTTLSFQWSPDLSFPSANAVPVGAASSATGGVNVTVSTLDAATDTIVITVPAAKAAGGKLFGRLAATVP